MAESSEARYKAAFATSSASLNLPSGMLRLTRCANSFSASAVGTIKGPDRGLSGARRNLVHPDFAGSEFRSQIPCHGPNSAFCSRIGSESRYSKYGLNRTIQYDRRAFRYKQAGGSEADAAITTSDPGNLVSELHKQTSRLERYNDGSMQEWVKLGPKTSKLRRQ
jgi:hypothetical protein